MHQRGCCLSDGGRPGDAQLCTAATHIANNGTCAAHSSRVRVRCMIIRCHRALCLHVRKQNRKLGPRTIDHFGIVVAGYATSPL